MKEMEFKTKPDLAPATATYTLTITPDYVSRWGLWESVRELIQNVIDQCASDSESMRYYDYSDEVLTIGATNCRLEPKTLLLGVTSKSGSQNMIGQFGEGYKLAMLVLTRMSYQVCVYNCDHVWIPAFVWSDEYECEVLQITVHPHKSPVRGVFFQIRDVDQDRYGEIHENFLMDEPVDSILTEEHFKGKIYIGGLYVCEIPQLAYGYNFAPGRIKLDRDRGLASQYEVTFESSRLWSLNGNHKKLDDNIRREVLDVQYLEYHASTDLTTGIVERFAKLHPNKIPVASEAERQRCGGRAYVFVSKWMRDLMHRMNNYVFDKPAGSPCSILEGFDRRYRMYLPDEGKQEIKEILELSKDWQNFGDTPAEQAQQNA